MNPKPAEIVIPKEKAVFWLDKTGCWHNVHGKFEHPKIIAYFHSVIKKDEAGYHLFQIRENGVHEKVYFHYEDTALFVFDAVFGQEIVLVLNTGRRITLQPDKLLIQNDNLYMQDGDERIKFSERVLMKLADLLEEEGERFFIRIGNRRYAIETLSESGPETW